LETLKNEICFLWFVKLMKIIGNEKANNIYENKNMVITLPRATPQCSRSSFFSLCPFHDFDFVIFI
jgi:hypothetical protein